MNPYQIIEKYYDKDTAIYRILKTHSEQVAEKTLQIADKHPELQLDTEFLVEAALLHDIGIFKCHAPGISCFGEHKYIEHGYLGAEILRSEGFPKHALVCERHTGAGLSLEMIVYGSLPLPHRDMLPVSMEEKVICYADKFYSKSHIDCELGLEKVRNSILRHGSEQLKKFDLWHAEFG